MVEFISSNPIVSIGVIFFLLAAAKKVGKLVGFLFKVGAVAIVLSMIFG